MPDEKPPLSTRYLVMKHKLRPHPCWVRDSSAMKEFDEAVRIASERRQQDNVSRMVIRATYNEVWRSE